MELKDFPRPQDDTGIGFHASPGGGQKYAGTQWDNWAYDKLLTYYKELHDVYGIRWWKFLGDGSPGSVMNTKAAKDAGMEPICRRYVFKPHWSYVLDHQTVAAYVAVGCHYFEFGNEPNLALEVEGMVEGQDVYGHDKVVALCNQIIRNVDEIVKGGGIALLPAMSPGTVLDETGEVVCYQSVIKWFQNAVFDDGTRAWDWFVNHCKAGHIGLANHPRGGNHVVVRVIGEVILDYPLDPVNQTGEPLSEEDAVFHGISEAERQIMNAQRMRDQNPGATLRTDPTSYQSWELVDDLFIEALGFSLPIFATEAGPEPFELWDGRYPRTTIEAHKKISMELIRRLNPKHPKAARQSLFSLCFWTWDNEGHGAFRMAAWKNNQELGMDLPATEALKQLIATEPFTRNEVEEEEPVVPDPIINILYRVLDSEGKRIFATQYPEKALHLAMENNGYVTRLVNLKPDPIWPVIDFRETHPADKSLTQMLFDLSKERDALRAKIDDIRRLVS